MTSKGAGFTGMLKSNNVGSGMSLMLGSEFIASLRISLQSVASKSPKLMSSSETAALASSCRGCTNDMPSSRASESCCRRLAGGPRRSDMGRLDPDLWTAGVELYTGARGAVAGGSNRRGAGIGALL